MQQTIKSQRLGEEYIRVEHSSGLTLLLCPMKEYSTAYALFGTRYGSIDTCFKTQKDADFVTVPEGIAHFLEHKLFENEDGDAFAKYAKTGASANAYTSFDKTCYLFACSENFKESLEILLDFVTHPYFTEATVQKEQGIIGQEIRMYDDDPDWRVFFNVLGGMYQNHPVRIDIAGTVESIAKIDADLLYRCYHTFYNLHNMVLAVAGNFDPQVVLEAADRLLPPAPEMQIERRCPEEPGEVTQKEVTLELPIAVPLFQFGFKGQPRDEKTDMKNQVLDDLLVSVIAGEFTETYRSLYDGGLINSTFGGEVSSGRGYICTIFSGESRDPKRVAQALSQRVEQLKREGIPEALFTCARRAVYGRYIGMYTRPESVASLLLGAHFAGGEMYDLLETVASATPQELQQRLKESFDCERTSLSIVYPTPTKEA